LRSSVDYRERFRQMSWDFPIFFDAYQTPQEWCKFRPNSDFMVTSTSSLCPFIISDVVSQKNESGRYRMLIQAIAVARAGQYLMRAGEEFFVVGIYLRANMIAERFVVAQIKSDKGVPDTRSRSMVRFCVHRNPFFSYGSTRYPLPSEILTLAKKMRQCRSFAKCTTSPLCSRTCRTNLTRKRPAAFSRSMKLLLK
jgi:hypothetical protein